MIAEFRMDYEYANRIYQFAKQYRKGGTHPMSRMLAGSLKDGILTVYMSNFTTNAARLKISVLDVVPENESDIPETFLFLPPEKKFTAKDIYAKVFINKEDTVYATALGSATYPHDLDEKLNMPDIKKILVEPEKPSAVIAVDPKKMIEVLTPFCEGNNAVILKIGKPVEPIYLTNQYGYSQAIVLPVKIKGGNQ